MRVGSLFSGIDGIDLGFEQAGLEIVWANDIDAEACKTYRHNFLNTHLIEGDMRDIDPCELPDIDVLVAGFPCQPFSIMGYRRGFKDPRGNLFFEISRFIDIKRPRVVFLENVQNLMEHDNGKTFLVIYNTLVQFGYSVKYKVINVTDVNIPQKRARIFIVAFLNIDDSGVATRKWELCPTLKANMGTYHDRVPIIRDDFGIRKLTPMECLAFQGYPKEYAFKGVSLENAYKQCGNTVCVPVIKSVANNLFSIINASKEEIYNGN